MDTKLANEEDGSSQIKKSPDDWKFPTIPISEVYKNSSLRIFQRYAVKDFEETVTLDGDNRNVSLNLFSSNFLNGFIKKHHKFMHLGLVQIAIKPLLRDGLGAPLVVCLRDTRHLDFQDSLLALVESDLSKGPFYFNCFPSFSFAVADASSLDVMIMKKGTPFALTYRVVCKAMVDLRPEALKEPVVGETTYFQPAHGTQNKTKWDEFELKVHEALTSKQEPTTHDGHGYLPETLSEDHVPQQGRSKTFKVTNEERGSSRIKPDVDGWKYPKIPVNEVYHKNLHITPSSIFRPSPWSKAKKVFRIFPSYSIEDFEKTVILKASDQDVSLKLLEGIFKFRSNGFVHLGLVQVCIKPLMSENFGSPVIVCIRDARFTFEQSFLSLVQSDTSEGPFYFNCCPGFSLCWKDRKFLTLDMVTDGVPLALTYRVVCKVSTEITLDLRKCDRGETTYYQPMATTSGTERTTKWDGVQLPRLWTYA